MKTFPLLHGLTASFLLLVISPTYSQQLVRPDHWHSTGIAGGSAFFYPSISQYDDDVIFSPSDLAGMFYTKDGGRTWDIVPFQELIATEQSQVHFTSDPNILYTIHTDYQAAESFPAKSEDGGVSWDKLLPEPTNGQVQYLFADPNAIDRLILSSNNALFYSGDAGTSFQKVFENPNQEIHLGGVFWDDSDIYVGLNTGLLVSKDNGASFHKETLDGLDPDLGIISLAGARQENRLRLFFTARNADEIWLGIRGSSYYGNQKFFCAEKSQDAPLHLMQPGGYKFDEAFPFFVGASPEDINVVYTAGSLNQLLTVYKSIDGGLTWERVFKTENNENIRTGYLGDGGDLEWTWNDNAMGFAVSPTDPNMALVTDYSLIHITKDGGDTWAARYVFPEESNPPNSPTPKGKKYTSNGLENTSVWWLGWNSPTDMFAAYTDITAVISDDGGASWSFDYDGLTYWNEDHLDKYNTVYHLSQHPSQARWYASVSSLHDLYQSHILTDNDINQGSGAIMVSETGGKSWSLLHDFEMPVIWTAIDPSNTEVMYASAVNRIRGGIWKTMNLSLGTNASWERLPTPPRTVGHPFNVHVLNDGAVVCTFSGQLVHEEEEDDYVFTETSGLFYSENGGQSWEDRSHDNMLRWTKDLSIDPHDPAQNTWYVGVFSHWGHAPNEVGGIYKTTDRGETWTLLGDFYRVHSLTLHPSYANIMFVGTESEGLWYTDNLNDPAPIFHRLDAYPFMQPVRVFFNPFDDTDVWVASYGNGLRRAKPLLVPTDEPKSDLARVKVFPNPASEVVHFQLSPEFVNRYSQKGLICNIFDMGGKLVHSRSLVTPSFSLTKAEVGTGAYLFHIRAGSKKLITGKVIFQ